MSGKILIELMPVSDYTLTDTLFDASRCVRENVEISLLLKLEKILQKMTEKSLLWVENLTGQLNMFLA